MGKSVAGAGTVWELREKVSREEREAGEGNLYGTVGPDVAAIFPQPIS